MLDFSHIANQYGNADLQTFLGTYDLSPLVWQKPRGKSMARILLIGSGGHGGSGAIGAASTAGGGGGGGSGAQTLLTLPLWAIPDQLYLLLPAIGFGFAAVISISPDASTANVLALAGGGGNGGNASGATNGTAGSAGGVAIASTMPLGWMWADQVLAGQAGASGATALALPTTGLLVTGGTSGAALPAAGAAGVNGTGITGSGIFPSLGGGAGNPSATAPADNGRQGYQPVLGLLRLYGGTGGASTHGTATGAGLVQSRGGNGMPGCGGGGNGGALTGSTAAPTTGQGGPALCQIICW